MKQSRRFSYYVAVITSLHVGVLLVVIVWPLLRGCFHAEPKTPELITFVQMAAPPPPTAVQDVEDLAPAPQPEPPEPEPVAPPPAPVPVPEPKPKPKLKKPDEINISRKKIKREQEPPVQSAPAINPDDIRDLLSSDLLSDTQPVTDTIPAWYYALIRQMLYQKWQQPASVPAGTTALVRMRVSRGGAVSRQEMIRSSGDRVMDTSVMQAARSVTALEPLPDTYPDSYKDITVEFTIER